ncbi:MAG TPA: PhzF family phenazine biosynthesis protein [Geminicoccaceae bacterium]|nr:PhzF family phenazine biosynthesis protein [Geminicoccus sp.]HMU49108.1 PhzF family phenazine biosynthesis protein [Geminicoccaceae bacterium]
MRYAFHILDVFTDRPFGGNQLAVLPDAAGLGDARMQQVAAEFGFSETTFVLPPTRPGHDCRVRIFTPRFEMPFAGHPTIGTAIALAGLGRAPGGRVVMEQIAGTVPVDILAGSPVEAELTAPEPPALRDAPELAACAALVGLGIDDVATARIASAGAPFLFVELRSLGALGRARVPAPGQIAEANGLALFTRETGSPEHDLRMRMFAPDHGIAEDPATGSAAAALGGLLATTEGGADGWRSWRIGQGIEMGRPSLLRVRARREAGKVAEIRVAGAAVTVAEGTIEVP